MSEHEQVLETIFSDKTDPLLVVGHGGTGKTFTAISAITTALKQGCSVMVLCPTHQAKEQFYQKLPPDIQQRITIKTTASFLLQYPNRLPTGEMYFRAGGRSTADTDYIFVDECSMISESDMRCLASLGSKVIFFGDFNQLRPVMKKQGDYWRTLKTVELRTQHRNTGAILELATEARNELIFPTQGSDCGSVNVVDTEEMLFKKFLKKLKKAERPYDVAYLAYRNAVVDKRSEDTHRALYGERPFVKHQYVRLGQKCNAGNNGTIVQITKTRKIDVEIDGKIFNAYRCNIRNVDHGFVDTVQFMDRATQNEVNLIKAGIIEESHVAYAKKDFAYLETLQSRLFEIEKTSCMSSSPYVQTVHKSQGRTIPHVFVNTLDIKSGNDRKRLLYVAYSRARDTLTTVKI